MDINASAEQKNLRIAKLDTISDGSPLQKKVPHVRHGTQQERRLQL